MLGMGGDVGAENGKVHQSFYMANPLPFPAWGKLKNGVDSCNLECSCNSVMFIRCSDYNFEKESHFLAILNKPCALISNLQ